MKTINTRLTTLAMILGLAGFAHAAPPGKMTFQRTNKVERISSMKPGDRYVLVCTQCDSASVHEVTDAAEVEKLCHDGGTIHCDSCKKKVTIKWTGPRGKTITGAEVKYVNSKGEECMKLIPLK